MGEWRHGQFEALWGDPAPTTPEGQRLFRLFTDGKLGTSASGIRDFGQRVTQVEHEAAEQMRLRAEALELALRRLTSTTHKDAGRKGTDTVHGPAWMHPTETPGDCLICAALQENPDGP